jgi:hypothetical protein
MPGVAAVAAVTLQEARQVIQAVALDRPEV